MRLLVITARYPTLDRPAAGSFVHERLADPSLSSLVVAQRRYDRPGWVRYVSLTWRALTQRGHVDGVDGHFVLPSAVCGPASARRHRPTAARRSGKVLYLGGSAKYKGVETARRLANTLAGPGIREVAPEEVPALIAAHDVVLVPSLEEGFGLTAAESIASGRWVVA